MKIFWITELREKALGALKTYAAILEKAGIQVGLKDPYEDVDMLLLSKMITIDDSDASSYELAEEQ